MAHAYRKVYPCYVNPGEDGGLLVLALFAEKTWNHLLPLEMLCRPSGADFQRILEGDDWIDELFHDINDLSQGSWTCQMPGPGMELGIVAIPAAQRDQCARWLAGNCNPNNLLFVKAN